MTTARDTHNQIEYAKETGLEEGLAKGLAKGREEGREERNLEVAINFLQLGTPCEIVATLRACLLRRLLRCFAIRLRRPRSSLFRKLRTRPSAG